MKTKFFTKQSFLFAAMLAITSIYSQNNETIKGNDNLKTKIIKTSDYDGISCAGFMDYILVSGDEGTITLEGEENLLEYIVAEVKDNTLKVYVKKNFNLKTSKNKTIKITIPFKDITNVSLAGSGDLWNEDKITSNKLDVALAGSGDVTITVDASVVEGKLAGSGNLTLKGNTNSLVAKIAGSGDFHGFELQSNDTEVSISGSGDAEVVSNKSIIGRVAGSGDIAYRGNPEKEDNKVSGSGDIERR